MATAWADIGRRNETALNYETNRRYQPAFFRDWDERIEKDIIGGFNSMLAKQKKAGGECRVTTVLFDDTYELLHDRIDLQAVRPMMERDYETGGSTALLDAVGRTIHKIGTVQR